MCGWPPARKRKVDGVNGVLAVMCPAFLRRTRPLATMESAGWDLHQILGFEALLFSRLTRPVGVTDTSITFSLLQAL